VDTIPLSQMGNLTSLKLNNANLNNSTALEFIKEASNLRNLSIARNQFQPLDMSNFPALTKLEYININHIKFVHHAFLKQRFPNLKFIDMTSRSWTCNFFNEMSNYVRDNFITWLNKPTAFVNGTRIEQRTLLATLPHLAGALSSRPKIHPSKPDHGANVVLIVQITLAIIGILLEWVRVFWSLCQKSGERSQMSDVQ
jgi:Leucine-rich repeat (LRR) protein